MKTSPLLFIVPLALAASALQAGQDEFKIREPSSSRLVKHEDGSRSYFERTSNGQGMRKRTYNVNNVLVSVTYYSRGKFGQLTSCLIYDGKKNELFHVSYGYNQYAELVEERMFDSKTKELVRRFLYRYDAQGNRSKPICITLVKTRTLKSTTGLPLRKGTPLRTTSKRKTDKCRNSSNPAYRSQREG